jgi:hypothetical protein
MKSSLLTLNGLSPWLPRRLTEAPGIQRLGYLQQKLPLSLHTMQILEGPKTFVCPVLHTLVPMEPHSRRVKEGASAYFLFHKSQNNLTVEGPWPA